MPRVFSFGSNGSGQLGIGHLEDVSEPKEVKLPSETKGCSVISIIAGGNHTVILFSNGYAYASGDNSNGRCSFFEHKQISKSMVRVGFADGEDITEERIKLCSATWEATIFVLEDGKVYSCGTGNKGELGLGDSVTQARIPQLIRGFPPIGTKVVDIASCMSHTIAILSDGTAFGWGNGRKGQLGLPASNRWTPQLIKSISFKAHSAACGRDFTVIIGEPFSGCIEFLGLDKYGIQKSLPTYLPHWTTIVASWSGIYMLLNNGNILSSGRNDHNQLVPQQSERFGHVAAGSEHILCKTIDGKVLGRGWGEHGNCGDSKDQTGQEWNHIPIAGRVSGLAAGCATSWIIVD